MLRCWRGVSRINDQADLFRAYDDSGEMLMHLQAAEDHDVFARSLSGHAALRDHGHHRSDHQHRADRVEQHIKDQGSQGRQQPGQRSARPAARLAISL